MATRVSEGDEDANMMDIGEKGRPPGDPPYGGVSWAAKVAGGNSGGMLKPEDVLDDTFVKERVSLEFPDGVEGEPVITIGNEVLEAMNGLWKHCMTVKVLGRKVSVAVLNKRLRELWKPEGAMYVLDLPCNFFMVRFGSEEEYLAALTGGPWRVFGSYLMVKAWSPEFDPLRDEIVTTPVWIRLSNLPVNYYHRSILMGIAKGLGEPIRVDSTTLKFERARFARVCVEVDLSKPLKGSVLINGVRYFVAYEGLSNICARCGVYGHSVHSCLRGETESVVVERSSPLMEKSLSTVVLAETRSEVRASSQSPEVFTMVRRSGRRGTSPPVGVVFSAGREGEDLENQNPNQMEKVDAQNILVSNSFGMLSDEVISEVVMEEGTIVGGKMGNTKIPYQGKGGKSIGHGKGTLMQTERAKNSSRGGNKNKMVGSGRAIETNGPRPRKVMTTHPTRGLVFGPVGGDVELSSNGKRLRVETAGLGRSGGAVVRSGDGSLSLPVPTGHESNGGASMQLSCPSGREVLPGGASSGAPEDAAVVAALGNQ